MKKTFKGQSTVEYFIMMIVVLVAIATSGVIGKVQTALGTYFNKASAVIVNPVR